MTLTANPMKFFQAQSMTLLRAITLAVVMLAAAGLQTPAHAQSIAALVNGEAITNTDIEQRIKLTQLTAKKTITRQEALDELINDKVKIKEGKRYGLDLSAADIDSAYANMASRMRMNDEQLSKTLENNGIRPQTLKARMKADMTWGNLVRGRFNSTLTPADKDLRAAMGEKEGDDKTAAESFEYKMRPIVLVVPRGAAPSAVELRRKEAELLRQRIDGCDQAAEFFRSMRDAAIRDQVVKTSADLSEPLRELLDKTPIGKLTPPEITKQGIEMVALCGRESTKTDTPAKRALKEKIYSERYEAKSKSYLQEIRKGAMIEMR
ncbi:MAG: SurA N-terminal domain-containing protein [Pseudomonadota bacterium]